VPAPWCLIFLLVCGTPPTSIYTLSLHDALPIYDAIDAALRAHPVSGDLLAAVVLSASPDKVVVARSSGEVITITGKQHAFAKPRSEEHTSELQSRENLVCRLLLEKKKQRI